MLRYSDNMIKEISSDTLSLLGANLYFQFKYLCILLELKPQW